MQVKSGEAGSRGDDRVRRLGKRWFGSV